MDPLGLGNPPCSSRTSSSPRPPEALSSMRLAVHSSSSETTQPAGYESLIEEGTGRRSRRRGRARASRTASTRRARPAGHAVSNATTRSTTGPGASTRRVLKMWGMTSDDVFLATGPIYHAAGSYAFLSLHAGSTVSVLPKFDGLSWLRGRRPSSSQRHARWSLHTSSGSWRSRPKIGRTSTCRASASSCTQQHLARSRSSAGSWTPFRAQIYGSSTGRARAA